MTAPDGPRLADLSLDGIRRRFGMLPPIPPPCPNPDHCRYWLRHAAGPWSCSANHPHDEEPQT